MEYIIKNLGGGAWSCTCPSWKYAGGPIDRRTCKHIREATSTAGEYLRITGQRMDAAVPLGYDIRGTPPPVMLARSWSTEDPTGWYMSEKLDGVRAYWDGRRFLSREGNAFTPPAWFTAGLPNIPLDGELWLGRGRFTESSAIARRAEGGDLWKGMRFSIFDAPSDKLYEERLLDVAEVRTRYAVPLHTGVCQGARHLELALASIVSRGGEGLMLRKPRSVYADGRSPCMLKVKRWTDTEAVIVAHYEGKGKNKGKCGGLVVSRKGVRFNVGIGLTDAQRVTPPPVGAVVTIRYNDMQDGLPRFPRFIGLRPDVKVAA